MAVDGTAYPPSGKVLEIRWEVQFRATDGSSLECSTTEERWRSLPVDVPNDVAREYCMSSDYDDRWRTGGSVAELKVESKIEK